jgi:GT2 family glycosyltransferase
MLTDAGLTDAGLRSDDDEPAVPDVVAALGESPITPASDASATSPIATVVIVNYNGAHLLEACLDGLRQQDMPAGSFKVLVVDNASADPSRDLIRESYPEVELLVSYRNRGFAGGNNVALHRVDTEFAVLLNNDAIPEPDWLRNLLAPLQADPEGRLVATASKIVFMPRFVRVSVATEAYLPGGLDPRELGVKLYQVLVDDKPVTGKVLFEKATYGPEGSAEDQFRWTFPTGTFLVPVPDDGAEHSLTVTVGAHLPKDVTFRVGENTVTVEAPALPTDPASAGLTIDPEVPRFDVINNAGGIVFVDGAGADRGFQEIDDGQYDQPEEVFTACGNGVAIRSAAGHAAGWFDDRYFMYYEDVDLSWRLRAAGGVIRYQPTAVLRHVHSASSNPGSANWVFHVERNRLLTLTKDASAGRAARGVLHFTGLIGKMSLRAAQDAVRTRRRPSVGHIKIRAKVLGSYTTLLPGLIRSRREIDRQAVVGRAELEKWLVTHR